MSDPQNPEGPEAAFPVVALPDKLFFKIGEVAKLTGIKPYVLRYWETEFPAIRPQKSRSLQRLYRRKDVETVLNIRDLLYEQRFTIEGARRRLRELAEQHGRGPKGPVEDPRIVPMREVLFAARDELRTLLRTLQI